jgi:chaperonin cofactor prefoldin
MNSIASRSIGVKSLNSKSVEQSLLLDELKMKLQAFSDSVDEKMELISQRLTTIENQLSQHDTRLSEIES